MLVAPVIRLLRASKSLVFQDVDSIRPGKKWRDEIAAALASADQVMVFWCDHSALSPEVKKEWGEALRLEKDVIPLLLDSTPLPPELAGYQWIDFRVLVGDKHAENLADIVRSRPLESPAPSWRWLLLGSTYLLALGAVLFGVAWWFRLGDYQLAPNSGIDVDSLTLAYSNYTFIVAGIAWAIFALRRWITSRSKIKESHSHSSEYKFPNDYMDSDRAERAPSIDISIGYGLGLGPDAEQQMACKLESEILKRFESSKSLART